MTFLDIMDELRDQNLGIRCVKLIEAWSIAAVLAYHKLLQIAYKKIIMLF